LFALLPKLFSNKVDTRTTYTIKVTEQIDGYMKNSPLYRAEFPFDCEELEKLVFIVPPETMESDMTPVESHIYANLLAVMFSEMLP
jgi:hypothetical protein